MDLAEILELIKNNTEWLYTVIYQNKFFFLDYWSFVHFFSGFILPIILTNLKIRKVFLFSLLILVLYEVVEISLIYIAFNIFKPENIKDQFTDIVVGLTGIVFIERIRKQISDSLNRKKYFHFFPTVITPIIISFIWVGFYQYKYNYNFLNNDGFNLWAFGWWSISLFLICHFYSKLRNKFSNQIKFYLLFYLIYSISLVTIEFIGYKLLGIKEIFHTNSQNLIFNLIHGTPVLHIFYLLAPFIAIMLYKMIFILWQNYFNSYELNDIRVKNNILRAASISK